VLEKAGKSRGREKRKKRGKVQILNEKVRKKTEQFQGIRGKEGWKKKGRAGKVGEKNGLGGGETMHRQVLVVNESWFHKGFGEVEGHLRK